MKTVIVCGLILVSLISCTDRLDWKAEQKLKPQFKQLIIAWLDQNNGYEVDNKSEILEEYFKAKKEAYKKANGEYPLPERPPKWREYKIDIKSVKRSGENLIVMADIDEETGNSPDDLQQGGKYTNKYIFSNEDGKYKIVDEHSKMASGAPWVSVVRSIERMKTKEYIDALK